MKPNGGSIRDRSAAREPKDELLPLISGHESLEELRQMIIQFSLACQANENRTECPFHIMGTLSYSSLSTLVNSLTRTACVDLFQLELESRSKPGVPCEVKCQKVTR
ncbi:MAG: hypothetical protein WCH99_08305 [Verrucomicrobiota bacterium]